MAIEESDITLAKFLAKFTIPQFPDVSKIEIEPALFLQVASLLKISSELVRLNRRLMK